MAGPLPLSCPAASPGGGRMRAITRSSSGASPGTGTGGPKRLSSSEPSSGESSEPSSGEPSGPSSGEPFGPSSAGASRASQDRSSASPAVYGCPVDRARSQPWTTSSLSATAPATSPGSSTPPARVRPVQASGERQAAATSSSRRGSTSRQSSSRTGRAASGETAVLAPRSLRAASRKAVASPVRWPSSSRTA